MKAVISESIQFTGSDEITISQRDKFEGTTVDIRIHDRADAIRLAKYLLQWAETEMTKPEWSSSYNCHTLDLCAVRCRISWQDGCYKASVYGADRTLKLATEFQDLEVAKKSSMTVAKKMLNESLALLNHEL